MNTNKVGQIASHDEIKRFYDTDYYDKEASVSPLPWHMRLIADRLGHLRDKQVLDVACGSGAWLSELHARGAKVAGIDISSRAVSSCRQRLPGADIREGVAESLPFETGRFDIITCLGSLEHFVDQPKALQEMRRVARKDAVFLILVPNAGFLTRQLGWYRGTQQAAIRETVPSIADWQKILGKEGLIVMQTWRDLHPLSRRWIASGPLWQWPVRAAQAAALVVWPLKWQYQLYFQCIVDPLDSALTAEKT